MSDKHGSQPSRPKGTLSITDLDSLRTSAGTAQAIHDYILKTMIPSFYRNMDTTRMAHGAGGKNWANPFGRFTEADDLVAAHEGARDHVEDELKAIAQEFHELSEGLKKAHDDYVKNEAAQTANISSIGKKPVSGEHLTDAQRSEILAILNPPPGTTSKS